MKKKMCSVVGGLSVLAACGALAQTQVLWDNPVSGEYTEASKWRGGKVPGVGEQGRFTQSGSYTITFGAGFTNDVSMTAYDIPAADSGTLTFDTRGSSWIKPTSANLMSDHTFRMNGKDNHSFNIETTDGGGGNRLLQFELTDALMTVERDPSLITTTLHSGLFNIYDAGGDAASGVRLVFGHSGSTKHRAVWKAGSTSRIRQVDFRGAGAENVFLYEGGTHTVFGSFLQGSTDNTRGEVRSTGGLLDVRTDFRVGNNPNSKMALLVDGGTVIANYLYSALATNSVGTVVVSNGSLTVNNNLEVASSVAGRAEVCVEGGELAVRNAYIGHRGTGTVEVAAGRWVVGGDISVGRESTGVGGLTLSGGSLIQSNSSLRVANTAGAQGTLFVTGGEHFIRELNVAPDGGAGYAEISDGSVTADGSGFLVGNNAAGTNSVLVVSGGKHTVRGTVGISVGGRGLGRMEISGGEVDCYTYVRLGRGSAAGFDGYNKANTNRISSLRMSGDGILRVLGDTLNVTDEPGNASRIILDGGSVYARNVRGWRGSDCRDGDGYSELTANGGRVVPLTQSDGDVFMETFDLAMLGDAGLTVDTDGRNARINQTFIPQPGARGRLVKTGVGTLRLGGQCDIGDIEVNGGTLAFQAAGVFMGCLVVTNGATVSLTESSGSGLALASLTLGDASLMSSRLMLRNTDTITITGPGGLNIINGRVFLDDPSVNGAYTLFRCVGAVALPAGLELGNGLSNKDYAWSAIQGVSDTDIILSISNRVSVAPIEWTGASGDQWGAAANWLGLLAPAKGLQALFPETAQHKNIAVTPGAVAGELDFRSTAGYTLGGTETLTLDNSGRVCLVNVGQGTHQITAPLTLKRLTTIDIDAKTALTLASVTGEGAIQKNGTGLLTLSGSANFTGGFTVQDGILALTSAEAFGVPSADSDRWTLAGGTLRYAGPSAARGNSIAVDVGTRTNTAAVVVDVGDDLALNGNPKVIKGVLIKRGTGTLAFNTDGPGGVLSVNNGKVAIPNAHPNSFIQFDADGQPPTDGYTGFNIAEGKVRITNTDATAPILMRHATSIGLQTRDGNVDPELEIDHATVRQGDGGYHLFIGGRTPADSGMTNPVLRLVNNATLEANTLQFGLDSSGVVYPKFIMDASTAKIDWAINVRQSLGTTSITITNRSEVIINRDNLNFDRPAHFLLDDSLVQLNNGDNTSAGIVIFSGNAAGSFTLRNGARMRYQRFRAENPPMNFAFDGGTLEPLLNDTTFAFRGDNTRPTVELLNRGLTFNIGSGMTYTLARSMTGSGAFRKAGAGRLTFAGFMQEAESGGVYSYTPLNVSSNTPIDAYTGGTWVDAGTLAVSNGTIRTDRRITVAQGAALELGDAVAVGTLAGNGTVAGGTLTQGTLAPGLADGETGSLTLADTALSGVTFACDVEQDTAKTATAADKFLGVGTAANVTVDFGRTTTDPLLTPCTVVIGTYDTANPPAVNTWKVKGIGRGSTVGVVAANGGILTVNVRFSGGSVLMLR